MASVNVGCRVPPEWRDQLVAIAQTEQITVSDIIAALIADRLGHEWGDRVSQLERRVSAVEGKLRRLGE